MEKFLQLLEEKLMPIASKIGEQKHLSAVKDGIILTMPLTIIGSVFLMIGFLPISGYPEFMAGIFGEQWLSKILYPVGVTFDIIALVVAIGVAFRLAQRNGVDSISAAVLSLVSFLLVTPYNIRGSAEVVRGIPIDLIGSKGMFVAIIVALISTEIYTWFIKKNIIIKMPDGVPEAVSKSFAALIPGIAIILTFLTLKLILEITPFENLHMVIGEILGKPLSYLGGTYWGAIIAVIIAQILWMAGIHGQGLVFSLMGVVWLPLLDQNRIAFQAGQEIPNIINNQFMDLFYSIGGSGATLGLALLLFFKSKSKHFKEIGKLAIGPGLFNINEPILFGIPIIMNPMMFVPFILVPITTITITYVAMKFGFVAKTVGINLPWTMLPGVGGYLVTGGKISGAVMQFVNIGISTLIYYPFFKMLDAQSYKLENPTEIEEKEDLTEGEVNPEF